MNTYSNCPNCGSEIKSGFFNSTEIIKKRSSELINKFTDNKKEAHCSKCSSNLLLAAENNYKSTLKDFTSRLKELVPLVPVNTLQEPQDWKYKVMGMVTSQSVTGTGAFSEFASSFTDLFGMQSGAFNSKIKNGERLCKSQLRLNAVNLGANAVIATDIDYAEVGGGKGMLMVCMSGTAIRLENPEVLGEAFIEKFEEMNTVSKEIYELSKFRHSFQVASY